MNGRTAKPRYPGERRPEAIEDLLYRRETVIDDGIGEIKDPWLATAGRFG
jgi:hypothetical protein